MVVIYMEYDPPKLIFKGLNMFLVPIKLGPFKFSPYLILIILLVPKKKFCTQD